MCFWSLPEVRGLELLPMRISAGRASAVRRHDAEWYVRGRGWPWEMLKEGRKRFVVVREMEV